jgi:regulator of sigma E protease
MAIVRYPLVVDSLLPSIKIQEGTVKKGDTLINIGGYPIQYVSDLFRDSVLEHVKERKTIDVTFRRGQDTVHAVVAQTEKNGNGIIYKAMEDILGEEHRSYTLVQAIPAGIRKTGETLTNYIRNLKLLFTSKEVKVQDNLGSVISIASVFPSVWDWQSFWTLTGIFSILLAFMNVLPIPALDGGHALFTLVEIISGRKPSDKFIEYAQMVGMVLLFGLMIYALGLDIFHVVRPN